MRHTPYREHRESGSAFSAMIVGFLAGAATVFLSKRENRERVQNKFNDFLEMGEERVDQVSGALSDMKEQGRKRLSEEVGRVQERLEDTADSVRSKVKSNK